MAGERAPRLSRRRVERNARRLRERCVVPPSQGAPTDIHELATLRPRPQATCIAERKDRRLRQSCAITPEPRAGTVRVDPPFKSPRDLMFSRDFGSIRPVERTDAVYSVARAGQSFQARGV